MRPFAALHESVPGTSRHFVVAKHCGRFWTEADVKSDLLSTRPSYC
jgi:hypothetical protein